MKKYPNFTEFAEKLKSEQRFINTQAVKKEASKKKPAKWLLKKIENHLKRNMHSDLGTVEDFLEQIRTNDIVASYIAVDPAKQNITEKLSALYIPREYDGIKNFKNLANDNKIYVINGFLENNNVDDLSSKTVDFYWEFNNKKYYASQKYTKDKGGAQDNQFNDLFNFGKNTKLNDSAEDIFVIIADGEYYSKNKNEKFNILFDNFDNDENVFVVTTDTLYRCLK